MTLWYIFGIFLFLLRNSLSPLDNNSFLPLEVKFPPLILFSLFIFSLFSLFSFNSIVSGLNIKFSFLDVFSTIFNAFSRYLFLSFESFNSWLNWAILAKESSNNFWYSTIWVFSIFSIFVLYWIFSSINLFICSSYSFILSLDILLILFKLGFFILFLLGLVL